MRTLYTSTTALAASQVVSTPWMDRAGAGDVPFVTVSVLADQAGSFLLYEAETKEGDDARIIGGSAAIANLATVATANQTRRFLQVVYTNGTTAQTSFALTVLGSATPHIAPTSTDWRILDLILRELRVQSLLLQALREPTLATVNLPYGPNNMGS